MNNIVIVGGSSGIGLALCQKLTDSNVTNISRTPCRVAGVTNIAADVRDFRSLEKAFKSIHRADMLIYCAGCSMAAPVEYAKESDITELIETNLTGAVICCKLAMPLLRESGCGKILLLSSSGGVAPIAFDAVYSATKAALNMFAAALRLETDVKCTAAVIGGTRTRFSFKRKVYTDCGDYDGRLKPSADYIIKLEQNGYTADHVAEKCLKILRAKNPPTVATIGCKNKAMLAIYKLLPKRLALYVLKNVQTSSD